jgi:hypothetical protein
MDAKAQVRVEELVLTVTGMGLPGVRGAHRADRRQDGRVRRVSADHAGDQVKVVVDSAGSAAAVRAGITAAGFEVR